MFTEVKKVRLESTKPLRWLETVYC